MGKTKEKMSRTANPEYLERIKHYPYLNPRDAGRLMQKSPTTIYDAIYSGELEHVPQRRRGYKIKREALDDWMERGSPT